MNKAGIPATRESHRLLRVDGKRPNGLILIPWREGCCQMRDVTVADTTAAFYRAATATLAKSVAESAAVLYKEMTYVELSSRNHFFPIAIESHGPLRYKGTSFLSDLGRHITISTSDTRETSCFFSKNLHFITKIQYCLRL